MKKLFVCAALISALSFQVLAAIDANTNLALGGSAYGTFSNPGYAVDGRLKAGRAISGDITDTPQYLTIDLANSLYLDRVKVYWDKDAYSDNFSIRTSPDAKSWNEEASGLDAANGVLDDASGTMAVSISLKRAVASSRYVQVMVPAGSHVKNANGNVVSIAEVQVYPSLNQKFTLDEVGDYAVADTSAYIMYKTSIGAASGAINYGTDPNKLVTVASNSESGVTNSVQLTGLNPKTVYFYQVNATDFYGNIISSEVRNFTTSADNIALGKKVTGTFTALPGDDKYVKPGTPDEVLARVTDGGTSYFTSMATSGPLSDADQFVVIDLGKSYKIKSIISYWRRLAYPESLTVLVSDNNVDWTAVEDGIDVGMGAFGRSDAGDPMKVWNTKLASGRYVKLLAKKGGPFYHKHDEWNFIQLMEVKVFAE